jgi:hypothetical protein
MKDNKQMGLDFDITIDDNNSIRILSADKYAASEKLKGESNKFVSSKKLFLNKNFILYSQ